MPDVNADIDPRLILLATEGYHRPDSGSQELATDSTVSGILILSLVGLHFYERNGRRAEHSLLSDCQTATGHVLKVDGIAADLYKAFGRTRRHYRPGFTRGWRGGGYGHLAALGLNALEQVASKGTRSSFLESFDEARRQALQLPPGAPGNPHLARLRYYLAVSAFDPAIHFADQALKQASVQHDLDHGVGVFDLRGLRAEGYSNGPVQYAPLARDEIQEIKRIRAWLMLDGGRAQRLAQEGTRNPDSNAEVMAAYGLAAQMTGSRLAAGSWYRRAFDADASSPITVAAGAVHLAMDGQRVQARALADKHASRITGSREALVLLGCAALEWGDRSAALAYFHQAALLGHGYHEGTVACVLAEQAAAPLRPSLALEEAQRFTQALADNRAAWEWQLRASSEANASEAAFQARAQLVAMDIPGTARGSGSWPGHQGVDARVCGGSGTSGTTPSTPESSLSVGKPGTQARELSTDELAAPLGHAPDGPEVGTPSRAQQPHPRLEAMDEHGMATPHLGNNGESANRERRVEQDGADSGVIPVVHVMSQPKAQAASSRDVDGAISPQLKQAVDGAQYARAEAAGQLIQAGSGLVHSAPGSAGSGRAQAVGAVAEPSRPPTGTRFGTIWMAWVGGGLACLLLLVLVVYAGSRPSGGNGVASKAQGSIAHTQAPQRVSPAGTSALYVTSQQDLFALDPSTGRQRWTTQRGIVLTSFVTEGTSYVVVITITGQSMTTLTALNAVTGSVRWEFSSPTDFLPSGVYGRQTGDVYVATDDGIDAINAETGHLAWQHSLAGQTTAGSPALAVDTLVVAAGNHLIALDAATGLARWTYQSGAEMYLNPASVNGVLFSGDTSGAIYALDVRSGQLRWQTTAGSLGHLAGVQGSIAYVSDMSRLMALDAASGSISWSYPTTAPTLIAGALGNTLLGAAGATVFAVNTATGAAQWTNQTPGNVLFAAESNGIMYAYVFEQENQDVVYAFDASNGKPLWNSPLSGPGNHAFLDFSGALVYACDDSTVHAFDGRSGATVWTAQVTNLTTIHVQP